MPTLRIALAQTNVTVGDLAGNRARLLESLMRAKAWQADLVVFPELAVTGYPPEDLLLKPRFIEENLAALRQLAPASRGVTAIVGFVDRLPAGRYGTPSGRLANAAAVLADGRHVATYRKQCLPNYGVFDEKRYFAPGEDSLVLSLGGTRIGLTICEDLWEPWPIRRLAQAGCSLIVNLSASPYDAGKLRVRRQIFAKRARQAHAAIAYCNVVGGQDELVFDGSSFMLDAGGRVVASGWHCREDLVLADLSVRASAPRATGRSISRVDVSVAQPAHPPLPPTRRAPRTPEEEVYEALVLGLRDYVRKNGFETVVLGLSGGIDSSLTACLAVDALGRERVVGVVMPSRFSSRETQADARSTAQALGIRCEELSIEPCFTAYLDTLKVLYGDRPADVTEQNIQARIRGNLLMALSNKFGWLVLTTGNKSEMATGYCTLYGDMAGGFAVIKDVPKTLVYRLARWRNRGGTFLAAEGVPPAAGLAANRRAPPTEGRAPLLRFAKQSVGGQAGPIPESVFRRAPTAELAPNQADQDTLPPYEVLDPILKAYVEEDRSFRDIVRRNRVDRGTVQRVIRMVDRTEYKRRQSPPGIKITPKAFGRDRRMPITNRYEQS